MLNGEVSETIFRWGRIQTNSDWLLPLALFLLLVLFFVRRSRVDACDIKPGFRSVLLGLRLIALIGLLLYYLQPHWEQFVGSSRIILLIDSSASMANRDVEPNEQTRHDAVLHWLTQSRLAEKFSEQHDVICQPFSDTLHEEYTQAPPLAEKEPGWNPDGSATALGDVLLSTLQRERGQPLAGIVLISDGGHNAGHPLDVPLETAKRLRIPIYPIGVGQTHPPLNYRLGTLDLPERVLPNDPFALKVPIAMIGGSANNAGSTATIELLLDGTLIESKNIVCSTDAAVEATFDVRIVEPGKHRLSVQLIPPQDDHSPEDNRQQIEVNVIDRKDRILLFASAPSRDYQFFCAQLVRDKTASVDAFLPWAQEGISQNVDTILTKFPSSRSEMSKYDVLIAFDPDWRELSPEQIDLLEFWTARQGGGIILVAGHVHQADTLTGWVFDPGMDKIRAMYPVEFGQAQSSFEHRYHAGQAAYPLKFSRSGEDAVFLQFDGLDDYWDRFAGFFGYFSVKGIKPTATLLASSGSPDVLGKAETGALIVEQFYGSGRVLYFGSGELWRLRRVDEKAFEQIVTKIVRYIGQGRLQRESDRGNLTMDKQRYTLGSMGQIRLTASDPQLNPLIEPTSPIEVLTPGGTLRMLDATLDPNTPGLYLAYIPLDAEGTWTVQWAIPEGEQKITRSVQVQMSDLERENPHRNESLLQEIAERSGGEYFADFASAASLPEKIDVRSQRAVIDETRRERLLFYILLGICVVLLLEWTLRRLMRLA